MDKVNESRQGNHRESQEIKCLQEPGSCTKKQIITAMDERLGHHQINLAAGSVCKLIFKVKHRKY